MPQVDALLDTKIEHVKPGITQAIQSFGLLKVQADQSTLDINMWSSEIRQLHARIISFESVAGNLFTRATVQDVSELSARVDRLTTDVSELRDSVDEAMEKLHTEWVETLAKLRSTKTEATAAEGASESFNLRTSISEMERRITENLRRHSASHSSPATPLAPDEINSIVPKVLQNARFQADVISMIKGEMVSHAYTLGDIPSRLEKLEGFVSSKTQAAPNFNVFSSSTLLPQSAMYVPRQPQPPPPP